MDHGGHLVGSELDPTVAEDFVANFVLVRFPAAPRHADAAFTFLQSRGVVVRKMGAYGLGEHLRITIGLEEEMRAVVAALGEFLRAP